MEKQRNNQGNKNIFCKKLAEINFFDNKEHY